MPHLVNRALLDLYDRYGGDLGLLDERWARKEDRAAFSTEQVRALGEYVVQLHASKVRDLTEAVRSRVEARIKELEAQIDPEVSTILRQRLKMPNKSPETNALPG